LTEVPEHLLARSRARRAAISGDGGEAPAAPATPAPAETAPAASAPATVESSAPATVAAAAPAVVEPTPPWVEAAQSRKKIPFWAVAVLFFLPIWAVVYALTLDPPTEADSPLTLGEEVYLGKGCSGCHGAAGGGGGAIPGLTGDGDVTQVWPTPGLMVAWIALGSDGWKAAGNETMENGQPVNGGMPGWETSLTPAEIMEVTLHERATFNGEAFDAATWEEGFKEAVEQYMPDQAAEYEAVLEEWTAAPPT
jgi:mono/diheme cytochrome c family protein